MQTTNIILLLVITNTHQQKEVMFHIIGIARINIILIQLVTLQIDEKQTP